MNILWKYSSDCRKCNLDCKKVFKSEQNVSQTAEKAQQTAQKALGLLVHLQRSQIQRLYNLRHPNRNKGWWCSARNTRLMLVLK